MKPKKISYRRRFFKVAWIFLLMVLDFRKEYFLTKRNGYKYSQNKMRKTHLKRARQLYDVAISLQGAMIKLCQYFSTRRDIFPESYIKVLTPLQDHVPPIDFSEIQGVLRGEYGDYHRFFDTIEERPLASASLGQVHRAVLRDGSHVVLKILKPRVDKLIDVDFAILFYTFKLLSDFKLVKEKADLFNLLEQFILVTGDELNFTREVYITNRFRQELANFSYLKIPRVYDEFSTGRIIVMEYLEGDKINEVETWKRRNNDPMVVARRVIEIYAEQLLMKGIVHFDPHPGNILVTDDSCLVLLDFGMSGIISQRMKGSVRDALEAFIKKDYRRIIDIIDDLGFIRKGVNKYSLLPVTEFFFDKVLEAMKLDRESVQTVDFSPVRDELVNLIYAQPFVLPTDWAYIGKTISSLVWLIAMLNPDFKIYEELAPYAERMLKKNYHEIASRAAESVKENVGILLSLPGRINNIVDSLERGYYRIKIDYGDIYDKIDEFREFLIKFAGYFFSASGCLGAYIFYSYGKSDIAVVLLAGSFLAAVAAFRYKMRLAKDRIKKYF